MSDTVPLLSEGELSPGGEPPPSGSDTLVPKGADTCVATTIQKDVPITTVAFCPTAPFLATNSTAVSNLVTVFKLVKKEKNGMTLIDLQNGNLLIWGIFQILLALLRFTLRCRLW
jgi:hypothetical protein